MYKRGPVKTRRRSRDAERAGPTSMCGSWESHLSCRGLPERRGVPAPYWASQPRALVPGRRALQHLAVKFWGFFTWVRWRASGNLSDLLKGQAQTHWLKDTHPRFWWWDRGLGGARDTEGETECTASGWGLEGQLPLSLCWILFPHSQFWICMSLVNFTWPPNSHTARDCFNVRHWNIAYP